MDQAISESDLKSFFERLGHLENGCSEWLLVDPKSREIRGGGFFTDLDLFSMAAQNYAGSYNLQVCRNPRPRSLMGQPGMNNQFNRSVVRSTPLEQIEVLTTTVLLWRSKGKTTLEQVGAIAAGLMSRQGINEYSVETSGAFVAVRIRFNPSPIRRFGSLDDTRKVFARLEEHFRDSLTSEEKGDVELIPNSSPELHDSAVGVPQYLASGWTMGRWLYAPAEKADAVLDQMLTDLGQGRSAKAAAVGHSTTMLAVRTDGLVNDWTEDVAYGEEPFVEGGGILPKGAKLQIESEESKQAKGQIENLEALAREAYLGRVRTAWRAPVATKPLSQRTGGGTRPGEVWLIEGNSFRAVQDWLISGIENILKGGDALVFWTSSRLSPGAFHARGVERLAGKSIEDIEGMSDPSIALQAQQQYRQQFKRMPMLFPHAPTESLSDLLFQQRAFRHSDEALSGLPGLCVVDGLDDFGDDASAFRALRHFAQDAYSAVWIGAVGPTRVQPSLVDLHLSLVLGEPAIRAWLDSPAVVGDADLALSRQVLPRLFPELAQGRVPCAVRVVNAHEGWTMHAYHLYYPGTGRFQNIVPKKEG